MGVHDGHRQRMKARFLQQGLDGFADHEVLELLLYYAIPRRDTNEIAHRLLERYGSVRQIVGAPVEDLCKVEGMGENAAVFLSLLGAVGGRFNLLCAPDKIISSVEDAGAMFLRLLHTRRHETLYQLCLDGKGKLLGCYRLSSGTTTMIAVNVREVVENALRSDATSVLLGHNHPSGVALPSEADRQVTVQIQQTLQTMGIELKDHIVVADGDFVSMAASGMLL